MNEKIKVSVDQVTRKTFPWSIKAIPKIVINKSHLMQTVMAHIG